MLAATPTGEKYSPHSFLGSQMEVRISKIG